MNTHEFWIGVAVGIFGFLTITAVFYAIDKVADAEGRAECLAREMQWVERSCVR